jgi:predicted DNA-binding transcriptional regulator AlpA
MSDPSPAPATALQTLDRHALAGALGISTRTLDRMRNDRGFPKPFTPPGRRPLWSRPAVDRWLDPAR